VASEPDFPPMDDAERARRRAFVAEHRTAVFGHPRHDDGPSMSVVYYVMEGDDRVLVSTMRDRGKAKAVARNPRVSLCVLDEQWPLSYLLVYATAEMDPSLDSATDLMMRISEVMAGHPMPPEARADAEEMCRREHRVVLTLSPYATFQTPPRHVREAIDLQGLTHWTSASPPW
jgi:PPOX class probable F420-dependent enzyme